MKRLFPLIVLVLWGLNTVHAQATPLNVVATTTIVADVAKNVGGDRVNVTALVPPDADAHAFEPTPQDVATVASAQVLLAAGAGYETFLSRLLQNTPQVDIVFVSAGVTVYPLVADESSPTGGEIDVNVKPLGVLGRDVLCGTDADATAEPSATPEVAPANCDPHVWTDPKNGEIWADNIAAAFAAVDPDNADFYRENADAYKQQLEAADADVRKILDAMPTDKRVLLTNHEFLSYFARAYGFRVVGVVISGGTTEGEPDPQQIAALISQVKDAGVPAVFAEASSNTRLIDTIAKDAGVKVVSALSESLTAAGGPADTYIGYLKYNAQTIAAALSGT
jgi:ABC-type Zn uptake system ZnuABC Zn-binding protein ZnuA